MHGFASISMPGGISAGSSHQRLRPGAVPTTAGPRDGAGGGGVQLVLPGMHIYFADRLDTFVQDLRRAPTVFLSVPQALAQIPARVLQIRGKTGTAAQDPHRPRHRAQKILKSLGLEEAKIAGSGSAPCPANWSNGTTASAFTSSRATAWARIFPARTCPHPDKRRAGYVGTAWSDIETRISPEGEIQIRSPGNMLGYYKEPELTAACYTDDGFFKTGDRGEYSPEGLLRITSRTKELFKTSKANTWPRAHREPAQRRQQHRTVLRLRPRPPRLLRPGATRGSGAPPAGRPRLPGGDDPNSKPCCGGQQQGRKL